MIRAHQSHTETVALKLMGNKGLGQRAEQSESLLRQSEKDSWEQSQERDARWAVSCRGFLLDLRQELSKDWGNCVEIGSFLTILQAKPMWAHTFFRSPLGPIRKRITCYLPNQRNRHMLRSSRLILFLPWLVLLALNWTMFSLCS